MADGGVEAAASGEILTPSEALARSLEEHRPLQVGGRVFEAAEGWQLGDAFAALELQLPAGVVLGAGDLCVLAGHLSGRVFRTSAVLERQRSATPAREFERFWREGAGGRLALRARIIAEVRQFFVARGFLEVDTPIWSRECGTEVHVEPVPCGDGYLITSPELHMKRLLVAGVFKSFQIVHCFRRGELGPLHSPEFSMLEWYRGFDGYEAVLADTEQLIRELARSVFQRSELRLPDGRCVDLAPPFLRLGVREAFARFAACADAARLAREDEDQFFQLLVDQVEPALAALDQPVFLYDYPATQAALARLSPGDASVAERFELYLGGVELCNGYGELTAADEQRARCEVDRARRRELGRAVPDLPQRFLDSLEQGMPRAGGNALGLDRLIALLCGEAHIDRVRPFRDGSA